MNCKKCGATMKGGAPGTSITCEYCGHQDHLPNAKQAPQVVINVADVMDAAQRPAVKVKPGFAVGCLLGIVLLVGGGIFVCVKKSSKSDSATTASNTKAKAKAEAKLQRKLARRARRDKRKHARNKEWTLANITNAPKDRWFPLSRDGMVGKLDQFDGVANYIWALKLAQGWSADARLTRLGFDHVRHDGIGPNLTERRGGSAEYRFFSPSRNAAAEKMSEVSEQQVLDGFRVWIRDNKVSAMITNVSPPTRTYPAPVIKCTYAQLLAAAKPIDKSPFYDFGLQYYKGSRKWRYRVAVGRSTNPRRRMRKRTNHSESTIDPKTCKRM